MYEIPDGVVEGASWQWTLRKFVTSFRIKKNSPTQFCGLYEVTTHSRRTRRGALSPSCQVAFAHHGLAPTSRTAAAALAHPQRTQRPPHSFRLQYILPFSIDKTSDQGRNPLNSPYVASWLSDCLFSHPRHRTSSHINTSTHQYSPCKPHQYSPCKQVPQQV